MCRDHRELCFSLSLIKVETQSAVLLCCSSKRAVADMLFKSLAARICSHSTLLQSRGSSSQHKDTLVPVEHFLQFKVQNRIVVRVYLPLVSLENKKGKSIEESDFSLDSSHEGCAQ